MSDVHPSLLRSIRLNSKHLLHGRVISIDPSSGSHSSLPAYAVFREGKLVSADAIQVPKQWLGSVNHTPHRLRVIGEHLRNLGEFDLLVVECFHWRPNARTDPKSMQQLNQSVGCITSNTQWHFVLQILGFEWAKHRPADYVKSDIADAIHMGSWAIELAEQETRGRHK